jgi:hypothetical protein
MLSQDKKEILERFNRNVRGVEICLEGNAKHCGKEGHWLETKMGLVHNSKNEPDLNGYEMKKHSNKTTLGDFSASEYLFSKNRPNINALNNWTDAFSVSRPNFIKTFGNPNAAKNNRYSWSGKCVPTYNYWNANGQTLGVTDNHDLCVYYSFLHDTRPEKETFPAFLQGGSVVIALWKAEKMRAHIDNKFNQKGFFMCKKKGAVYDTLCFGRAFNFDYFIECIKNKTIIFDSGMYEGNTRNYSQFRGSTFWDDLITEEY